MPDHYRNWPALQAHCTEGVDYRIVERRTGSGVAQLAIHAGGLEGGTGELAKAVAEALGHNLYCFEALRPTGNRRLHITSTRYDEPLCVDLQRSVRHTVSYHGAAGARPLTHLGGADTVLGERIAAALGAAGFAVDGESTPVAINGSSPRNICNRNRSGAGVQLELSSGQREAFFPDGPRHSSALEAAGAIGAQRTAVFHAYVAALVTALGDAT
ncbi:poly-gamma-glutamate hydrolase family protein [Phaeacidiphilus oryzae]|uniref:poly-gamma-glutamate hydrolase family protein n=1 Tax=Phaeacidiphilus oryzae TaxID=348818 RepID=UPI0006905103|nr:poly-gamma-glutamate hydrolase family protein [Phaeacidiphilus oryzae]